MPKQLKKTTEKGTHRERPSLSLQSSQPSQSLQSLQPSQFPLPSQSSQDSAEVRELRPRALTPGVESPLTPTSAQLLVKRRPSIQLPATLAWEVEQILASEEDTNLNYSRIVKLYLY